MKQNYFVFNGEKYYTGTVIKIKSYKNVNEINEVVFYYTNNGYYTYKDIVPYGKNGATVPEKTFFDMIVEVTEKKEPKVTPVKKKRNELDIDGMFIGWMWYIIIMLFCAICNGAIFGWVVVSVIFFKWRKKKINEEGYYYERQI